MPRDFRNRQNYSVWIRKRATNQWVCWSSSGDPRVGVRMYYDAIVIFWLNSHYDKVSLWEMKPDHRKQDQVTKQLEKMGKLLEIQDLEQPKKKD